MRNYQPYKYCPLVANSIRLLGLNDTDGSLDTLKTVHVDEAPPYFALSYSWGKQTQDVRMVVDDQAMSVSPSMAEAIQRLRNLAVDSSASNTRVKWVWVWIDKICINQDDASERSEQVQLMSSIYSQAIRTLIWLGPDFDGCSAAWGLVDQIYGVFLRENPCAEFTTDIPMQMYSDRYHEESSLPAWHDILWQHLRMLFELLWFTRIWVIQEVALSPKDPILLHGKRTYPWYRLAWVSSWLLRNGYLRLAQMPNRMQNVDTIANIRRSRSRWRLDALLFIASTRYQATDQRDKVYALLGLAAETQEPTQVPNELRPDYSQKVTEVYTKAALFLLREYKSLSFLARPNGVPSNIPLTQQKYQPQLLPSWAPNWYDSPIVERDLSWSLSWISDPGVARQVAVALGFPEHYTASAGLPAKLLDSPNQSVLRLSGLKAGTIVSATQFDDKMWSFRRASQSPPLLQLWKIALRSWPERRTLLDLIASWVKATTVDQQRLSGRTADQILKDGSAYLYNLLSNTEDRQTYTINDQDVIGLLRNLSIGGNADIYAALASNFCLNRKLIVTSEGSLGIGPMGAKVGDLVFVIFGGEVPYILRAWGTLFRFVGQSYIDGLMSGEAIHMREQGELEEEIIELR
ncbi:HET domain-containing protein [Nemania sp. FL0031]|nr:HET domain-containing protein [Nemania sp. FL0031]